MFVYPFFEGHGSWQHVQLVWDRWQSLNAATLAFLASLVAFNITRYNEKHQREREFVAAKAFLPSTFSGLMGYFDHSASIYTELWESNGRANTTLIQPELPEDCRDVFSNCIRHADATVGTYLSNILSRLQVHEARLQQIVAGSANGRDRVIDRLSLISYMYRLGELYALIGKQFDFARGEKPFEETSLTWENFRNAYSILGIHVGEIWVNDVNLEAFTRRAIERAGRGGL
jgi:hypothetical protein